MNIQGSIVALVTPMHEDGSIDFTAYKNLIDWHIEQGSNAILVAGTTGESATINVEEHCKLVELTVKHINKRIPVIAGTGGNSTQEAIELTAFAKQVGADASLQVVPYYNKPTQEGMFQHFKKISETVDLPMILYNVPSRTVADMHNETVFRLANLPNIIGIKDATGNLERGIQLIQMTKAIAAQKIFNVYSGDDATAPLLIMMGAKGNMSVTANIIPNIMQKIVCGFLQPKNLQELEQAKQLHLQLSNINALLFCEANPIPVKYVLYKMGKIPAGIRLPLTCLSLQMQHKIDAALQDLGIFII
jgi:4-hydroxy-tetrahydrodipicolinate synthase